MKKKFIFTMVVIALVYLPLIGCAGAPEPQVDAEPTIPEAPEEAVEEAAEPAVVEYSRGDVGPAGGIVFYVDRRNEHDWTYLEAAPAGWHDGGEDPLLAWGEMGLETGASGSALGTGAANTALIVEASGEHAAKMVAELEINGFDDWFLPSIGEIGEMYENLFRRRMGDLAREPYWTSTERNPDRAMMRNFDTAGQISAQKLNEYRIRPVRAF